ncbi:hypothetical protein PR048_016388 [Dryococelus australis]|uniref:Uncharacterized protein n=1 Tax=Dryococelus australis TaxID=614101 RepID=A0ABQ9HJL4_9NEOP|nr:hypothetical protein PR048_016388 [Dryococelus australis]
MFVGDRCASPQLLHKHRNSRHLAADEATIGVIARASIRPNFFSISFSSRCHRLRHVADTAALCANRWRTNTSTRPILSSLVTDIITRYLCFPSANTVFSELHTQKEYTCKKQLCVISYRCSSEKFRFTTRGRSDEVVKLLASHLANQVRFPLGSLPDFRTWTMPQVGGYSRGSPVSPPFNCGTAPYLPCFTHIGSQALDAVRKYTLKLVKCAAWRTRTMNMTLNTVPKLHMWRIRSPRMIDKMLPFWMSHVFYSIKWINVHMLDEKPPRINTLQQYPADVPVSRISPRAGTSNKSFERRQARTTDQMHGRKLQWIWLSRLSPDKDHARASSESSSDTLPRLCELSCESETGETLHEAGYPGAIPSGIITAYAPVIQNIPLTCHRYHITAVIHFHSLARDAKQQAGNTATSSCLFVPNRHSNTRKIVECQSFDVDNLRFRPRALTTNPKYHITDLQDPVGAFPIFL